MLDEGNLEGNLNELTGPAQLLALARLGAENIGDVRGAERDLSKCRASLRVELFCKNSRNSPAPSTPLSLPSLAQFRPVWHCVFAAGGQRRLTRGLQGVRVSWRKQQLFIGVCVCVSVCVCVCLQV